MLTKAPSYSSIVEEYKLTVAAKGGDLCLTPDGNIKVTKAGDIQLGSNVHHSMWRLIEAWRLNNPSLRLMFEAVCNLRQNHDTLEIDVEAALTAGSFWGPGRGKAEFSDYHVANDTLGAALLGRGALAGSLVIVTASLLTRFKADIEPTDAEWQRAANLVNGVSIGQAIIAAANSFRHHDEWLRAWATGRFSAQQKKSIDILIQFLALKGPDNLFEDINTCERLVFLLAENTFENFEGAVLKYANAVSEQVEARS